jgi:hypothetical protein
MDRNSRKNVGIADEALASTDQSDRLDVLSLVLDVCVRPPIDRYGPMLRTGQGLGSDAGSGSRRYAPGRPRLWPGGTVSQAASGRKSRTR